MPMLRNGWTCVLYRVLGLAVSIFVGTDTGYRALQVRHVCGARVQVLATIDGQLPRAGLLEVHTHSRRPNTTLPGEHSPHLKKRAGTYLHSLGPAKRRKPFPAR